MTRVLFDSDEPAVLVNPAKAGVLVATYADLLTPEIIAELGPMLLVIDRGQGDPHGLATIADIEPGLLSVAAGAAKIRQWVSEHRAFPTAYHDRNDWAAVSQALNGVPSSHWVATLDGTCNPGITRPAAVQILGADKVGFHADLSIVWDDHWHPAAAGATAAEVAAVKSALALASGSFSELEHAVSLL